MGSFRGARELSPLAAAELAGQQFAKEHAATTLYELRNLAASSVNGGIARSEVIIDGVVLTSDVDTVFARGEQIDVPTIVGFNANEGTPYPVPSTLDGWRSHAERQYGDRAADFLELYPAHDDESALDTAHVAMRDALFAWQSWAWASAQQRTGTAPVYFYFFNQMPAFPSGARFRKLDFSTPVGTYLHPPTRYGAYHGAELPYAFDTLNMVAWPWTDRDRAIAATMASAWVRFAKTGDPNGGNLGARPHI